MIHGFTDRIAILESGGSKSTALAKIPHEILSVPSYDHADRSLERQQCPRTYELV